MISISAISGWRQASSESRAATSAAARTSSGLRPRAPVSRPAPEGRGRALELIGHSGRERRRDVPQNIGEDAAEADEHERAETGIASTPDDQLGAGGDVDHLLDREARRRKPGLHLCQGEMELLRALDPQHDASGVGLVEQAESLESDRIPDRARGVSGSPRGRLHSHARAKGIPAAARSSRAAK